MKFDKSYYQFNSQDLDRPALGWYFRLWKRFCQTGPVLEFGCGVGHLARRLSTCAPTYGFEINEYALSQIKAVAPEVRIVSSLSELPNASLSSIIALHVLEHIPDSELLTIGSEFKRLLSSKGRILLVVPDVGGEAERLKLKQWMGYTDPTHINLKSATQWQSFFEQSWGVNVVKMNADGYYDFPYVKLSSLKIFSEFGRLLRTAFQFIFAALLLPPGDGEACVFILEKRE
jgi:SAM-dependent methyltransferase